MKINRLYIRIVQPVMSPYWRIAWFDDSHKFLSLFVVGMN